MLFSVHFEIQGYRLHLGIFQGPALVEAIVVVVKATQILCALELPNSTLSCFPLASCNPRLAKVLLYFFQKWHLQWWRATKKSLCGLYFSAIEPCILTKAEVAKDGHRNSIHNDHCSRAEPP